MLWSRACGWEGIEGVVDERVWWEARRDRRQSKLVEVQVVGDGAAFSCCPAFWPS